MKNIEKGSSNVYADLGMRGCRRGLNQTEAAELLGIPQPKVSNMLRGKFRGISEAKMLECLTRLGRQVQIVVKSARSKNVTGRVEVIFS